MESKVYQFRSTGIPLHKCVKITCKISTWQKICCHYLRPKFLEKDFLACQLSISVINFLLNVPLTRMTHCAKYDCCPWTHTVHLIRMNVHSAHWHDKWQVISALKCAKSNVIIDDIASNTFGRKCPLMLLVRSKTFKVGLVFIDLYHNEQCYSDWNLVLT